MTWFSLIFFGHLLCFCDKVIFWRSERFPFTFAVLRNIQSSLKNIVRSNFFLPFDAIQSFKVSFHNWVSSSSSLSPSFACVRLHFLCYLLLLVSFYNPFTLSFVVLYSCSYWFVLFFFCFTFCSSYCVIPLIKLKLDSRKRKLTEILMTRIEK